MHSIGFVFWVHDTLSFKPCEPDWEDCSITAKQGEWRGDAEYKTKLPVEAKNKVFRPGRRPKRSMRGLDSLNEAKSNFNRHSAPGIEGIWRDSIE